MKLTSGRVLGIKLSFWGKCESSLVGTLENIPVLTVCLQELVKSKPSLFMLLPFLELVDLCNHNISVGTFSRRY